MARGMPRFRRLVRRTGAPAGSSALQRVAAWLAADLLHWNCTLLAGTNRYKSILLPSHRPYTQA